MPSDASANSQETYLHAPAGDRSLPAGAGLALAVLAGTAIWGSVITLFLLF